jgi:kynureninase
MIYCVVPEALEAELFDKLTTYYADDENVTVIVDRRKSERRGPSDDQAAAEQREIRDRRRARVAGEFPRLDPE